MSRSFVGSSRSRRSAGSSIEPGEHGARLLAAGEPADRRLELLRAEEEAPRPARDVHRPSLEHDGVAERRERALERHGRVEPRAVLVEHHDAQARRVRDRALVRRLLAGEQAQQRALAAAVRAHEAEARAGAEDEVEAAARSRARRSSCRGPRPRRSRFVLRLGGREVDRHRRAARARVEVGELVLQPLRLVDARLGLARAGPGLAREPVELAAHAVAQRLLVGGLAGQQLVLRLEERAVAPAHVQEPLGERAVQLDHAAGHGLEEVAVVAHRHERLRLARQQVLEPEDALDVEVVRGLVEEQQLRLADERARDRQPLLPAAGEDARPLRPVGEAGLADRDRDAALDLVLVEAEAGEGLGRGRTRPSCLRRTRGPAARSRREGACAPRACRRTAPRGRRGCAAASTCRSRSGRRGRRGRPRRRRARGPRRAAPRRRPWRRRAGDEQLGHQRAACAAAASDTAAGVAGRAAPASSPACRRSATPRRRRGLLLRARELLQPMLGAQRVAPRPHAARPHEPHRPARACVARRRPGLVLPERAPRSLAAPA